MNVCCKKGVRMLILAFFIFNGYCAPLSFILLPWTGSLPQASIVPLQFRALHKQAWSFLSFAVLRPSIIRA